MRSFALFVLISNVNCVFFFLLYAALTLLLRKKTVYFVYLINFLFKKVCKCFDD